jgi:Peptidase S46
MNRIALLAFAVFFLGSGSTRAGADEGMWLFNNLPLETLKSRFGFEPDAAWSEHLMKSCVRFNVGGSASFVSSDGLVLTNHHVGSDTLFKLSTPERNILENGYLARTNGEELPAPDLELNQLVNIVDVTDKVNSVVKTGMPAEAAMLARREVIEGIQKEALDQSGLRSDVVTLYGGGRYHLYQYKKYTDVRLVWAPEAATAFMGGDADNFEYPRYCLDACIFRVYENGQPAKIEHFLKWSQGGPAEDELVFVAGNPGRTSRILTVDALKYQRDVRMPFVMNLLRRREICLQQFGLNGPEAKRRARDELFGVQNSRKAYTGMLGGLQNPAIMGAKAEAEAKLRAAIKADPQLASLDSAWNEIAAVVAQRPELLVKTPVISSRLFEIAEEIVQMLEEDQKPSGQRLPEYGDAGRESLLQQLLSDAPIYTDLETALLADSLGRLAELRGGDDPLVQAVLAGQSPADRAASAVAGCTLVDVAARKALIDGGISGLSSCKDPMIQIAFAIDTEIRKYRKVADELAERERQAYAKIAEAQFATAGSSTYPDATFTLRLAFGTVKAYNENGQRVEPMTDIAGAFNHQDTHPGQDDFQLPKSWNDAKGRIDGATPYNFVTTCDIIGGNSGSPCVNQNLEVVGLIFDGNIQSLTADYVYTDEQSRSVCVHSSAIREALRTIYNASHIADQLGR